MFGMGTGVSLAPWAPNKRRQKINFWSFFPSVQRENLLMSMNTRSRIFKILKRLDQTGVDTTPITSQLHGSEPPTNKGKWFRVRKKSMGLLVRFGSIRYRTSTLRLSN